MYFEQAEFDVRCEWGEQGVRALSPISELVIIVDVLSFSTCVDVAVGRGATVLPHRWQDQSAVEFARSKGAVLAGSRASGGLSLSPASLQHIAPGTQLVLPSPNGSTLTLASSAATTVAGCIRNSRAVAEFAASAKSVAVIPAGERWADGSLRPAVEDLIGAGAIIRLLRGTRSPEAEIAVAAFERAKDDLTGMLMRCASGKELSERGFASDVELSASLDVSKTVPVFRGDAYVSASGIG